MKKKNKVGGLMFPDFKTYYKATISERGIGTKTDIQTNGTEESSEIKLYIYGQMILTWELITSNGERTVSSTNGAGKTGYPYANEARSLHHTETLTQNGLKADQELKLGNLNTEFDKDFLGKNRKSGLYKN